MTEPAVESRPSAPPHGFSPTGGAALVVAVCCILFFSGLSKVPFYEKGEPREGLVAWEIWKTGNWILPLRAGVKIPSKPPLFHWIATATSLSTGSFNEFTVRFPSGLLGTLGVLVTYLAAVRLWGTSAGVVSAVVLATSPEWWRAATSARVDMTLAFFMLATFVYFYFLYQSGGGFGNALVLAFLAGLATLAKGPVGAALPGIAALAFLWRKRDFGFIRRLHLPIAIPFGVLVAGSWYLAAYAQGGEKFFLRQIVHEIIGTPLGAAGHNHNVFYYVPALIAGMAPWSLFFPALAIFLFHERRRLVERELLYPLIWFATVFVVLSLALGKRSVYILPLYPAVALLFGAWWSRLSAGEFSSTRWIKTAAIVAAALLLLVSALLAALALGWIPLKIVDLAGRVTQNRGAPAPIFVVMNEYRAVILAYSALAGTAACFVMRAAARTAWGPAFASLGIAMTASLWLIQNVFHPAFAANYSYKPFMARAAEKAPASAPVVFYSGASKAADFYARLYLPGFQARARPAKPPFLILIGEREWAAMRGQRGLTELDASETKGWDGRQRLYLVSVGADAEFHLPEAPEESDDETEP